MPPAVERVELVCEHCGTTFRKMACELTRGRGRFCSRVCMYASRKRGSEVACGRCGRRFYRKAGEMPATMDPFCSVRCYRAARAEGSRWYRKVDGRHEHRTVAEKKLGRKLLDEEVVHHIDGDPRNNDPANLEVLTRGEHSRLHSTGISRRRAHTH